jgi:hypothetical protein
MEEKTGVTCNFSGHLGNHLYQYVYSRLIAEEKNRPFKFKSDYIISTFKQARMLMGYADSYETVRDGYPFYQGKNQLDLINNSIEKIREWLIPSDFGKTVLSELGFPPVVNVRGGDFKHIGRLIHGDYYKTCRQFLSKPPIVVTDDVEYAGSIVKNAEKILHTDDDFSILFHSKELICSNSTYCWWAAFLGKHDLLFSPRLEWVSNNSANAVEPFRRSLAPFTWAQNSINWKSFLRNGLIV